MERYLIFLICSSIGGCLCQDNNETFQWAQNPVVKKFQEYLRIDTSRTENIYQSVEFWRKEAADLNLPFRVLSPAGQPICIITVIGTNPELPSIMLNSHMDVVTVDEDEWTYPPFAAVMDESGYIYARGSQDTKAVAIQYIAAIRQLKESKTSLKRTLHVTFMPDEELGGFNGMQPFVDTEEFRDLNIGFALDEGLASPTDQLLATYVDRRPWYISLEIKGNGGHTSFVQDETSVEKMYRILNKVMVFREGQTKLAKSLDKQDFGGFTSVNVNIISAGERPNVIPVSTSMVIDMRLAVTANVTEINSEVESWVRAGGDNTSMKYLKRIDESVATAVDESNPFWVAMKDAVQRMGRDIKAVVCPAQSDMVFVRARGVPALGFAPMLRTPARLHGPDERLHARTLLAGVPIYVDVIRSVANVP